MAIIDRILVDIVGLTTSPTSGGAYALILREAEGLRRLPIIIGAFEAQSIALEMEGIKPPRPLTHDLVKNILEQVYPGHLPLTRGAQAFFTKNLSVYLPLANHIILLLL